MAWVCARPKLAIMTRSALPLALASFVGFTLYTALVASGHGPFGFVDVIKGGGWNTQVFLDLCFALLGFFTLAIPDAKRRGMTAWPYLLASFALGSIAMLAYFVHRELRGSTTGV